MSEHKGVTITILGKDYVIACDDNERRELLDSANYLDRKMREIRDGGKIVGTDRIAVMAALNISHELLHNKTVQPSGNDIEGRIRSIHAKIERALHKGQQLEFEA